MTYFDPPKKCNICKDEIGNEMFDAKTIMGPWANMCGACFVMYGIKLGTGFGQKYVKDNKGDFIKVGG